MDSRKTGELIASIRKDKKMTQKQIAKILGISDKTISKWERGNGCPDITLIQELASVLQVDISSILQGQLTSNPTSNGNMQKIKFYVCPSCHNVITSMNNVSLSCCGKQLHPVSVVENQKHSIESKRADGQLHVTIKHVMDKNHYIHFIAYITGDKMYFNKLYPEQGIDVYFTYSGHGYIYAYCNNDGLFSKRI